MEIVKDMQTEKEFKMAQRKFLEGESRGVKWFGQRKTELENNCCVGCNK